VAALLLALGLVTGIVGLAANQAEDPTIRRFLQKRRLEALARKPNKLITLPEAEDALYLAHKLDDEFLFLRFGKLVASIKHKQRRHP